MLNSIVIDSYVKQAAQFLKGLSEYPAPMTHAGFFHRHFWPSQTERRLFCISITISVIQSQCQCQFDRAVPAMDLLWIGAKARPPCLQAGCSGVQRPRPTRCSPRSPSNERVSQDSTRCVSALQLLTECLWFEVQFLSSVPVGTFGQTLFLYCLLCSLSVLQKTSEVAASENISLFCSFTVTDFFVKNSQEINVFCHQISGSLLAAIL